MSDSVPVSNTISLAVRADRYSHLLSPDKLAKAHVAVIGCGAVGRQAAIQLASMGIGKLTLVDFDTVSAENLGPQGWREDQVGEPKVIALGKDLVNINPAALSGGGLLYFDEKFNPSHIKVHCHIVLSCVDSMEVRKEIFEAATADLLSLKLFAEARMAAESCIASFVTDRPSADYWLKGWYPTSEGFKEGCTTKSTIYCASMAASLLVAGVSKALRGHTLPWKASYNLGAFDGMVEYAHEEATPDEVRAEEAKQAGEEAEYQAHLEMAKKASEDWTAGKRAEGLLPAED